MRRGITPAGTRSMFRSLNHWCWANWSPISFVRSISYLWSRSASRANILQCSRIFHRSVLLLPMPPDVLSANRSRASRSDSAFRLAKAACRSRSASTQRWATSCSLIRRSSCRGSSSARCARNSSLFWTWSLRFGRGPRRSSRYS